MMRALTGEPLTAPSDGVEPRALEAALVRLTLLEHDLYSASRTAHDLVLGDERRVVCAAMSMHRHHLLVLRDVSQRTGFASRDGATCDQGGTVETATGNDGSSLLATLERNLEHALNAYDETLEDIAGGPVPVVLPLQQARMNVRLLLDRVRQRTSCACA